MHARIKAPIVTQWIRLGKIKLNKKNNHKKMIIIENDLTTNRSKTVFMNIKQNVQ